MHRIIPTDDAPPSWRKSFEYDELEVHGRDARGPYARAYRQRAAEAVRLLGAAVPAGASVLDVAGAQGNFTLRLAEAGYRVTWNDLRGDLEGYVRLKHERGTVSYAPGNVFDLRFAEPFDAVLATEVVEHVAHPDDFLRRLATLAKPGGCIVLTTPNGAYFRNDLPKFSEWHNPEVFEAAQFGPDGEDHIFLLHPHEVHDLARAAGLVVEELTLFTNPLTAGHVKLGPLCRALPDGAIAAFESLAAAAPGGVRERVLTHMAARLRTGAAGA